jgi:hypothetical protein
MTGMRPILIMPSSLAVGAAITANMMEQARSEAEKRGVTLVISPVGTDPYVPTVLPVMPPPDLHALRVSCKSYNELPFMHKQSAWERSHPNQPWYAQFQKKRKRKKNLR